MKKFFVLLVVIFLSLVSCQKDEELSSVDIQSLKAQLASISNPSKEEVQFFIEGGNLKSASMEDDATLIELFPLNVSTTAVVNGVAIRYFMYYEINANGYREKMFMVSQIFPVKDGKIDDKNYTFEYDINCPFSRRFELKERNYINQITYFFHFDDGTQFTYVGERNYGSVLLPPLAGGKWQLSIAYDNGDLYQEFNSELVNFDSDIINLKFEVKKDNVIAVVKVDKELTQGSYSIQLFGENQNNGDMVYVNYKLINEESLPSVLSFNAPFEVQYVIICGMNGCWRYEVVVSPNSPVVGPKVYKLKVG